MKVSEAINFSDFLIRKNHARKYPRLVYNRGMKKYQPRVRALKLARQVRERLTEELKQPVKVIMFGSQARGDTKKDSEDSSMMYLASDVAWEVGLDASKVISVVPAEKNEWRRLSASPFYRAVKREGIVV